MSLKIVVHGDKLDLADELAEQYVDEALEVIGDAGTLAFNEVQHQLARRIGSPRTRTAAPEGQPPELDTGELRESYSRIPPRVKGAVATSGVQSNHPGAARVEYGATDERGIRTLPHPAVRIAFTNIEPAVDELIQRKLLVS